MMLAKISGIARSKGDPEVISTGPSSFGASDRMARNLGWFSLGLGTLEILAPHHVTRALGLTGRESLVRAYGFREIVSGVLTLSTDKNAGLWSRVAGDGLDLTTLMAGYRNDNPRKANVAFGILVVAGITLLDFATAKKASARHARQKGSRQLYQHRSGFPKGIAAARGIASRHKNVPQLAS